MNENHIPQDRVRKSTGDPNQRGYIFLGAMLILIGGFWLLHNFGLIGPRFFDIIFSWQMLMIVVGGYLVSVRRYPAGIIIGGLGLLFLLADALDIYVTVRKVLLPSVVIAVGAGLLLTRIGKK